MTQPPALFAAVLAAGTASRFGGGKVDAMLGGKPLGAHSLHTIKGFDWAGRAVIAANAEGPFVGSVQQADFDLIINERPASGQARSLKLALEAAMAAEADGLFIALADMPFVSHSHVAALIAAFDPPSGRTIVATAHEHGRPGVPAIIGAAHFPALLALGGDQGARALLKEAGDALTLVAPPDLAELFDVDTPADLATARVIAGD
jgi:molybdenum cofactor cytidylyltransferase